MAFTFSLVSFIDYTDMQDAISVARSCCSPMIGRQTTVMRRRNANRDVTVSARLYYARGVMYWRVNAMRLANHLLSRLINGHIGPTSLQQPSILSVYTAISLSLPLHVVAISDGPERLHLAAVLPYIFSLSGVVLCSQLKRGFRHLTLDLVPSLSPLASPREGGKWGQLPPPPNRRQTRS